MRVVTHLLLGFLALLIAALPAQSGVLPGMSLVPNRSTGISPPPCPSGCSITLDSNNSPTITRTQGQGDSRQKMTFSFWVKSSDAAATAISIAGGSDVIYVGGYLDGILGGSIVVYLQSGADGIVVSPAALFSNNTWYHVVIQIDTANATSTSRIRMWVDGTEKSLTFTTDVTQSYDTGWGGDTLDEVISTFTGIMLVDEFAKIDNALLSPSSFATAGSPIGLSGLTFGAEGYWLGFETHVAATVGTDSSGQNNTFTGNLVDGDFSNDTPPN